MGTWSLYASRSLNVYVPSELDPLSHILALLRPREVGWRIIEGRGGWTLECPARRDIVVFGHLLEGGCEVRREGELPRSIGEGDFILIASPQPWRMSAPGDGPVIDLKAAFTDPALLMGAGDSGRRTRFTSGYFTFDGVAAELIGRLLPKMIHVEAQTFGTSSLCSLLSLLGDEAKSSRAGRSHVLERLLELMLVEALRLPGLGWEESHAGLLRGLADPRIAKSLDKLHADVARSWTVSDLAGKAGMSRSAYATRFQQLVGVSPIAYLLDWRMALARHALAEGQQSVGAVSASIGFQSISAFSTAFKRASGVSPARYARGEHLVRI